MSRNPEMGNVGLKCDTRKRLGEEISGVYDSGSVIYNKKFGFNVRANEVIVDVDVFGLAVIGIID